LYVSVNVNVQLTQGGCALTQIGARTDADRRKQLQSVHAQPADSLN
jgi:hypothetical protein